MVVWPGPLLHTTTSATGGAANRGIAVGGGVALGGSAGMSYATGAVWAAAFALTRPPQVQAERPGANAICHQLPSGFRAKTGKTAPGCASPIIGYAVLRPWRRFAARRTTSSRYWKKCRIPARLGASGTSGGFCRRFSVQGYSVGRRRSGSLWNGLCSMQQRSSRCCRSNTDAFPSPRSSIGLCRRSGWRPWKGRLPSLVKP